MPHDDDWQLRAACRGSDVDLFYSVEAADVAAALAICATCPVRVPCQDLAIQRREAFGTWGGTTEADRRRTFRRERRRRHRPAA